MTRGVRTICGLRFLFEMTNPESDNLPEVPVVEAEEPVASAPPAFDTRRRLRELLSVPERDRSDEQWDEIIELEIQLAPGNRIAGPQEGVGRSGGGQGRSGGAPQQKKAPHRPRTPNNRRGRQGKAPGGTGGGGGAPN